VTSGTILQISDLQKSYGGLRPLRIRELTLHAGQRLALVGLDRSAAEMFVNLVTGASVPDAGEVRVFGESTAMIADGDAWLASLDRFGILSERAVLLDQLTAAQNLAVPFTLALDPIPADVQVQVDALAAEVGLANSELTLPVAALSSSSVARVRLGRAVALRPAILLAEHPSAALEQDAIPVFAADMSKLLRARELATLVFTADPAFAASVAEEVLTLDPATGGWRVQSLLQRLRGRFR
jgi:predicted ABC-type transport system involved in lysophospholipase L1 biosynthesis ATPase subunit